MLIIFFQGLDTLTPTLIVGNGLKMVSHVLGMFSVLCTMCLGCDRVIAAAVDPLLLAAKTFFFHFHESPQTLGQVFFYIPPVCFCCHSPRSK